MSDIDVADEVHHGPSDEDWIVAAVDQNQGRLFWCGWPFGGSVELSDCTLVTKATKEQRDKLLLDLARHAGDEWPVLVARERVSRERIREPERLADEAGGEAKP